MLRRRSMWMTLSVSRVALVLFSLGALSACGGDNDGDGQVRDSGRVSDAERVAEHRAADAAAGRERCVRLWNSDAAAVGNLGWVLYGYGNSVDADAVAVEVDLAEGTDRCLITAVNENTQRATQIVEATEADREKTVARRRWKFPQNGTQSQLPTPLQPNATLTPRGEIILADAPAGSSDEGTTERAVEQRALPEGCGAVEATDQVGDVHSVEVQVDEGNVLCADALRAMHALLNGEGRFHDGGSGANSYFEVEGGWQCYHRMGSAGCNRADGAISAPSAP